MLQRTEQPETLAPLDDSCWNTIGVRGDRSCVELHTHVHCLNCPVYSAGAARLLDRPVSTQLGEQRYHYGDPAPATQQSNARSVVIFRIGQERFALPTVVVGEITQSRAVHSIPHRRAGVVLGVTNVRGELLVCVSLKRLLGIESAGNAAEGASSSDGLMLVVSSGGRRIVLPADEICGIHRFHARELKEVPATLSKAATAHSKAVVSWDGHVVGILDDQLLSRTVQRSIA